MVADLDNTHTHTKFEITITQPFLKLEALRFEIDLDNSLVQVKAKDEVTPN